MFVVIIFIVKECDLNLTADLFLVTSTRSDNTDNNEQDCYNNRDGLS